MAITYQRNTWETGKVITAKALNDIETGIVNIVEKLNEMDGEVTSQVLIVKDDATIEGDTSIGGTATIMGDAKFNNAVEIDGETTINGATTINNDITVGADKHIIVLTSPSRDNHVVTRGYVNGKAITSANDGITATGTLGNGISIELKPASTTTLGGIKVGSNLTINEAGVLNATDTTYALASTTADGLMSKDDFEKLKGISANATNNTGTVTGIKINNVTKTPTDGTVDISDEVITSHQDITGKADLDSPAFIGLIKLGDTSITESALQKLNELPQIPFLANNADDGTYVLQANKTTPEGATEPVITYSWVSVTQQNSGGEGS